VRISGVWQQAPDEGYNTECATSFGDAVKRLQAGKYDLVTFDHGVWNRFDEELWPYLRAGVPVLFCTADYDSNSTAHRPPDRPHALLQKPFDIDVLLALIVKLLHTAAQPATTTSP